MPRHGPAYKKPFALGQAMEMLSEFWAHYALYLPDLFGLPLELLVVLAGFGIIGAWLTDATFKHSAFGMMLNFAILQIGVAITFLVAMADFRVVLTENAVLTLVMAVFGGCTLLAFLAAIKNRITP